MRRLIRLLVLAIAIVASTCIAEDAPKPTKGMQVVKSNSPLEAAGNRFAFLVAVSDYAHVPSLHCTVNDVKAIRDQLLKMGFAQNNITMLTSEERASNKPTRDIIEQRFTDMLKRVKPGDWVFVYLSGHGTEISGKKGSFFCPEEVRLEKLDETTVSIDGMMKQLSESPASFRWMIVDACRDENSSKSAFGQKGLKEVAEPPANVSLIQSCQPGEKSYEGGSGEAADLKNGFFTISLLESFTLAADSDKDGCITFSEMFKHMTKRTDELARKYQNRSQVPMLTGRVTDFVLLQDLNLVKANELAKEAKILLQKKKFKDAKAKIKEAMALYPKNERYQEIATNIDNAHKAWLYEHHTSGTEPIEPDEAEEEGGSTSETETMSDEEFAQMLVKIYGEIHQKLEAYDKILVDYNINSATAKKYYRALRNEVPRYFIALESRITTLDNQLAECEAEKEHLLNDEGMRETSSKVRGIVSKIEQIQRRKEKLTTLMYGYSSTNLPPKGKHIRKIFKNTLEESLEEPNEKERKRLAEQKRLEKLEEEKKEQEREIARWADDSTREAGKRETKTVDGIEYAFRWCPAGTFMMGSPNSESGRFDWEGPQHEVTLTQGFWMLETEVTQAMWQSVMGNNPSNFKGDDRPVEQVSWYDCQEFCEKLTSKIGMKITLPTEAQWEYACRAGTTGPYAGDLDKMAWYGENWDSGHTHPVGQKQANAWGLYDMHGNVWEWCQDWYGDYPTGSVEDPTGPNSGSIRVNRGGGWYDDAQYCRSAYRYRNSADRRYSRLGFRAVGCPSK